MTSEQLLDLLAYLPDDAILRADPGHFRIRKKTNLRKILTFGGLTAALVLCTVGLTRFFSPAPGGSPSVQLPPVVATDTQTATTDTNSSTENYEEIPSACPPPHFHYQGALYSPNGSLTVLEELPEGAYYIGEGVPAIECIISVNHCYEDFCGNLKGPLYLSEDGAFAYCLYKIDENGNTLSYQQLQKHFE